MPRSHLNLASIDLRALTLASALAGVFAFASVQAKQSDSEQPVLVNAQHSLMSQDKELLTLTGNVQIDQGTMHLDGAKAVGNFDQDNKLEHAVLTGSPAHMRQQMDDGSMVHGQASNIDYTVSNNTVVLTGDAVVVHEGQGEFHGAKLTYNTDTGQIVGEGGAGGQVHMILQPKKKAAPAKKPAAAPKTATGSSPPAPIAPAKSASVATPPSPAASVTTSPAASSTH